MRTVFFVIAVFIATAVLAQQQPTDQKYTVAVDTSKVNIVQQVDQILTSVEKHGTGPMGQIYRAAVRKQIGVVFLVLFFSASFLYFGFYFNIRVGRERKTLKDSNAEDERLVEALDGYQFFSWALNAIGIILLISGVYRWISLDFYAMRDIAATIFSVANTSQ